MDSDGEALLWHLEDCVLRMDEILQEARDMRVVFDLRDVSAKNVWSVVGMGVIGDLTATIDRCMVMPMLSVEVIISSWVLKKCGVECTRSCCQSTAATCARWSTAQRTSASRRTSSRGSREATNDGYHWLWL